MKKNEEENNEYKGRGCWGRREQNHKSEEAKREEEEDWKIELDEEELWVYLHLLFFSTGLGWAGSASK